MKTFRITTRTKRLRFLEFVFRLAGVGYGCVLPRWGLALTVILFPSLFWQCLPGTTLDAGLTLKIGRFRWSILSLDRIARSRPWEWFRVVSTSDENVVLELCTPPTPAKMVLTMAEIRDLALFCGFQVAPTMGYADEDAEIAIQHVPAGLKDDADGTVRYYAHHAWFDEYPEEGAAGLGPEVAQHQPPQDTPPALPYVYPHFRQDAPIQPE
ncbi:MAG: hypothetical protein FJ276_17020 [Planctomycetes bacterium]|nr:hypothetical protein [Planctomycetota bacterium]